MPGSSYAASHRASGAPNLRVIYTISAAAVVLRVAVAIASRFTNEDAYITLRYAVHIAHGQGFCYNAGQHVLGTTTPLYTLLLALFEWLHLPALTCGKLVNILADGVLCTVTADWARTLVSRAKPGSGANAHQFEEPSARIIPIVATLIIALNPIHIRWAISGMETSLVTLCGAFVWLRYTQGRYTQAFAAMGVLFLLRWDSVLMMAALSAGTILRTRRLPWREITIYCAIILPWLIFATGYFGSPIPVTAASKMAVYGWRASHDLSWTGRHFPQVGNLARLVCGNPGSILLSIAALAGIHCVFKFRLHELTWPIVWFIAYWSAFLYSRVLLFPWYAAPPLPVYEMLAAIGLVSSVSFALPRLLQSRLQLSAAVTVTVSFAAVGLAMAASCRNTQITEGAQNREIGLWLKSHSAPGDSVMLEPIGYIGYYSKLNVVDVVGLVTPWTTFAYTPRTLAPMRDIALKYRPKWCVLRPGEIQHILEADRLDAFGPQWAELYGVVRVFSMSRAGKDPIVFTVFKRNQDSPTVDTNNQGDGR